MSQSTPMVRTVERRPYAPPRLTVHGSVQTLTQNLGGGQGESGGGDA